MANIGILGGTFDPPHRAHIAMARTAIDNVPLGKVLFMPAPHPPHKDPGDLSPYEVRRTMVRLAIEAEDKMELSVLEEFREGPSFTVELLRHFRTVCEDELYLIIGADSVADFPSWKNPERILQLATLVIFPRTGYSSMLSMAGDASVVLFEEPVINISSTEIREIYRSGSSALEHVPEAVHKFILDNSLYT
ncbi:MAG: nicotinate (nicotinamide) nucleotide adenylyltransferase [Candidatus Krumholzibacteria bacterium]|nr:nicotinate (nicotinamide) nucleotide adenylyltransferase [Candidatus Krumholzibacteria bacterium]